MWRDKKKVEKWHGKKQQHHNNNNRRVYYSRSLGDTAEIKPSVAAHALTRFSPELNCWLTVALTCSASCSSELSNECRRSLILTCSLDILHSWVGRKKSVYLKKNFFECNKKKYWGRETVYAGNNDALARILTIFTNVGHLKKAVKLICIENGTAFYNV